MKKALHRKAGAKASKANLGTFAGVFTPSVLTILGIILFLRLGYVVGSAGLARALIIIGLANTISVLTSFSLAAIATNLKVKGGGDYYLISRTLGVEFGGAIGIVLFLAQSVSIGFYCIGFGEAVAGIMTEGPTALPQMVAALAVAFLFIFAWLGADWATRFQYVVMSFLVAALISFFVGGISRWDTAILAQNWYLNPPDFDFWILFAIFFPAVTGFTQGVSMSGDLKDAGRSLPLGTFLAVGVSLVVYFGVALVFAASMPGEALTRDYGAMKRVAHFGFLIDAGVIAATLSSAMASFLGAPRILQSMAGDRIFPFLLPFAKGFGPTGNPRRGVLLSAGIAFATIGLGKLDLIAPVVSMFFLISYGLLNYATFFEARTASPSFRPRFKWFDLKISLAGWVACLGVILAIDLPAGLAGIAILFAIFQYLKRTAGPARWADSRRSYRLQRVREHLLAAVNDPEHPRDWRPQLLAFSNDSRRRRQLLRFASWLEGGSGLTTAVRIIEGQGLKMRQRREEVEAELRSDINANRLEVFPLVVAAPNISDALHTLLQSFGIGPLKANTILLNWLDQPFHGSLGLKEIRYVSDLRSAFRLGCNIVVLACKEDAWETLKAIPSAERRIDVWWTADAGSRLMLLLAYLMTRNEEWEGAKIRVMADGNPKRSSETFEDLQKMMEEVRIDAEPKIVANPDTDSIVEHSAESALVFLPLRFRGNHVANPYGGSMEELLSRLPAAALVLAAEDIDLDAQPEEGKVGEIAEALDALEDAEKMVRETEKEATEASEAVDETLRELQAMIASGVDKMKISRIDSALKEAKAQANKATRRAAKALAKAEDAARALEALGVEVSEKRPDSAEASEDELAEDELEGPKK